MIRIEPNNISQIKNDYFEGVKKLIIPRAKLLLTAFQVINGAATVQDIHNFTELETRTKTSLLALLGRVKSSITEKAHYTRLTVNSRIKKHYRSNIPTYIQLFTDLSNDVKLRELILAEVADLEVINSNWTKPAFTDLTNRLLNYVINYDLFSKKDTEPFNSNDLANAIQVSVCPYCNRVYTNTAVTKKGKKIIGPTFDHFYYQKIYPLLALSFYNLIPSCYNCNSILKLQSPFRVASHVHPYKEGFGVEAIFDFIYKAYKADRNHPDNYHVLLKLDESSLRKGRISNNIELFKLREIYQSHADVVGELAVKVDKESPFYAMSLFASLKSLPASAKADFYRYYFGNYFDEKDFNKRPLAKLTKDIVSKYLPDLIIDVK